MSALRDWRFWLFLGFSASCFLLVAVVAENVWYGVAVYVALGLVYLGVTVRRFFQAEKESG